MIDKVQNFSVILLLRSFKFRLRRHGQVVRQRIANPLFPSSNPGAAFLF